MSDNLNLPTMNDVLIEDLTYENAMLKRELSEIKRLLIDLHRMMDEQRHIAHILREQEELRKWAQASKSTTSILKWGHNDEDIKYVIDDGDIPF